MQLTERYSIEKVKEMLGDIVIECFKHAKAQQKAEGYIKLEQGFTTILLPGIDVPFHSHYLWAGVMPFCACKHISTSVPLKVIEHHINRSSQKD